MRIVSLFSGAGGADIGMMRAGHEIIWANDFDDDCCDTYRKNVGKHIILGDIKHIKSESIPDADVIIGGFPCQGFSQANLLRAAGDDRNKLYLEFLRIVKDKRPLVFLAENVRGILSLDKGNAIKKIISDFEKAGYRVAVKLFNMADYGVPQTRHRIIIAGIRQDLPKYIDFPFPEPTHIKPGLVNGKIKKPWVTISDALRRLPDPDEPHNLPNHIYSKYKVTNRNFTGHRNTNPNKPSPTILARGNGKGGVCAIQHPMNHRRMTIRESATIQTFPLHYKFLGEMNSCYRQVGNAVPVHFAYLLGKSLNRIEKDLLLKQK